MKLSVRDRGSGFGVVSVSALLGKVLLNRTVAHSSVASLEWLDGAETRIGETSASHVGFVVVMSVADGSVIANDGTFTR